MNSSHEKPEDAPGSLPSDEVRSEDVEEKAPEEGPWPPEPEGLSQSERVDVGMRLIREACERYGLSIVPQISLERAELVGHGQSALIPATWSLAASP